MTATSAQQDLRALCASCLRTNVLAAQWAALAAAGESVLGIAQTEGVVGLLAAAVAAALPSNPCLSNLHKALSEQVRTEVACDMVRTAIAREAITALAEGNGRVLVLKGAALAYWLYATPWQRVGCDVDVLVPDLAAAEVAVALLQKNRFSLIASTAPGKASDFEVELRREGRNAFSVDLHWRLINQARLTEAMNFDELWEASIPLPDLHPAARGLGPVHALVHALLHRITNFPSRKHNRLIWLHDIHLLTQALDVDQWQAFLVLCVDRGIAAPCLDGIEASVLTFFTVVPRGVVEALRAAAAKEHWVLNARLDQAAMDRGHLAALPWREKLRWLRRKLLPSREFMRHRYKADGATALLLAYGLRWWTGVTRLFSRHW